MKLERIVDWLDRVLDVKSFSDVSNNGVQIARFCATENSSRFLPSGGAQLVAPAWEAAVLVALSFHAQAALFLRAESGF